MSDEEEGKRRDRDPFGIGPSESGTLFWGTPELEEADREELIRRLPHMFHHLWTKAVGTPDYVKEEWKRFEKLLKLLGVYRSPMDEDLPTIYYPEDVRDDGQS